MEIRSAREVSWDEVPNSAWESARGIPHKYMSLWKSNQRPWKFRDTNSIYNKEAPSHPVHSSTHPMLSQWPCDDGSLLRLVLLDLWRLFANTVDDCLESWPPNLLRKGSGLLGLLLLKQLLHGPKPRSFRFSAKAAEPEPWVFA